MIDWVKAAFLAMMTASYAPVDPPNGHSDSFLTADHVDFALSQNALHEQYRTLMHPSRSQSHTILHEPFESLTGWSQIATGTAAVGIIDLQETDPAVGIALDMSTGATAGSAAGAQKDVGTIPASFGVMLIPRLQTVGSNLLDALNVWIENADNKSIRMRFNDGAMRVQLDGQWLMLSDHVNPYAETAGPEWWIQATKLATDQYKVCAYAGTEVKGCQTGNPPTGNGNDGEVQVTQQSTATAARRSQLAILEIGPSQLPDDMVLISKARTAAASPSEGCIAIAAEDVSVVLQPNATIMAALSKDDGATWRSVLLEDAGEMGWGELGTKKKIHLLGGCTPLLGTGQAMRYRIVTTGGGFTVIQNVTQVWQ